MHNCKMLRVTIVGILLCTIALQSSFCAPSADDDVKKEGHEFKPQPHPPTNGTTTSTTSKPTDPPTTTPKPTTPSTTTSTSTTTSPSTTSTTSTTTSTSSTTSASTPGSSTTEVPTTPKPPTPSDRKFDAFSFLGGFALGLGLVAIGILSWKFYLSRQENYYHTL